MTLRREARLERGHFRLYRFPAYLITMFLALSLCGCKQGPLPTESGPEEKPTIGLDDATKKVLADISRYQRDTGSTLETLAKEIARREAVEAQTMGPSPLQRDLDVARALLVKVRRAVRSEDNEAAGSLLRRLAMTVDVMQSETPAAQIRTYLERATHALVDSAGVEADVASMCLLASVEVALKSYDAPLVPDVAEKLEETKGLIDDGEYKEAVKAVDELNATVANHKSVWMLDYASAGVRGARQAMGREAGLVVLAELDQLSEVFKEFGIILKAGPPAEEEGEDEEAEEEEEEDESEEESEASDEGGASRETAEAGGGTGEEPEAE